MFNSFLLNYTRRFPIEYGKKIIVPLIQIPDQIEEYTNRYGVKFLLDTHEYQMKQIYVYDIYEKNTVRHITKLIKPDHIFFDVGSNIGFYSLTFATLLSEGTVHCFEPNQVSFNRLKHNTEINHFKNVILNNIGLSDDKGEVVSSYNLENTGTASVYKKGAGNGLKEIIHLQKADDYCHQNKIEKIDFIKVDIEGGEFAFLKGAEMIIKASRKLILVMEMMEENFIEAGYTTKEIFDYITSLGFKAYLPKPYPFGLKRVKNVSPSYSDNIVFLRGY
jgi:FkbM family methyltransferase